MRGCVAGLRFARGLVGCSHPIASAELFACSFVGQQVASITSCEFAAMRESGIRP